MNFSDTHDALTGLANRNTFEGSLELEIEATRNQYLTHSLCILKLDNLKWLNDTLGAKAADALLVDVAGLINKATRERDFVQGHFIAKPAPIDEIKSALK